MSESDPHDRLLISVKAILHQNGRVLLVKNTRSEWDLPRGKLHQGEDLEACLERELQEELGFSVGISRVVSAFKHHYYDDIMVVVYDCGSPIELKFSLSEEHSEGGWFDLEQVQTMNVPENYKLAATKACGVAGAQDDA